MSDQTWASQAQSIRSFLVDALPPDNAFLIRPNTDDGSMVPPQLLVDAISLAFPPSANRCSADAVQSSLARTDWSTAVSAANDGRQVNGDSQLHGGPQRQREIQVLDISSSAPLRPYFGFLGRYSETERREIQDLIRTVRLGSIPGPVNATWTTGIVWWDEHSRDPTDLTVDQPSTVRAPSRRPMVNGYH